MARELFSGVQIRMMSEDVESLDRATDLMQEILGRGISFTGSAPNRTGGARCYGTVSIAGLEQIHAGFVEIAEHLQAQNEELRREADRLRSEQARLKGTLN